MLRCPREVTPHLGDIIKVCQDFVKYDPNYTYDSEEDAEEEDEDDMDFSDEEYGDFGDDGDDDDTSWKVRRASLHVLSSIITSRSEMLNDLYTTSAPLLISRFREREENVRLDVLSCFTELLRMTVVSESRKGGGAGATTTAGNVNAQLTEKIPAIISAANKQLGAKLPVKTRSSVFGLLKQLVQVVPGLLQPHMDTLIPAITLAMGDKSSALKLDALVFLRQLMETHDAAVFHPYVPELVPLVVVCVKEDWYKIVAEALRVVGSTVKVIRPKDPDTDLFKGDFDFAPFVSDLEGAVLPRLQAHDIDQEIKESAISTMGLIAAHFADHMGDSLSSILPLLLERLRNEITRMPTLKALAAIAQSPIEVDLDSILQDTMSELSQFLRQQSRSLKQTTLETIDALVNSNGSNMSSELFANVMVEAAPLVSDTDLHLSHLALQLTVSVLAVNPSAAATVRNEILPRALTIAASPLLQGMALKSLLNFYQSLVKMDAGADGLGFDTLLAALLEPVAGGQVSYTNKQNGTENY